MENANKFLGWKYLTMMGIVYMFMMGFPNYGGPATAPFVLQAIPMDRALFGLGFTLFNLFVGLNSGLIAAPLIKRFGIRITSVFGCLMLVVVAILMQFITNPILYTLVFGVLTPIVLACGTMVTYSTWVTRWFVLKRGRAMGFLMTLASFGGFFAAPVLVAVAVRAGGNFRASWAFMGVVGLIAAVINWFLIKESPESVGQVPDGEISLEVSKKEMPAHIHNKYEWKSHNQAYKTATFWALVVSGVAVYVPMFFFVGHFTLHATSVGISPEGAATAISAFAICGVFGRLISGFLIDRIEARYVIATGLLFSLVGTLLALNVTGIPIALLVGGLLGAGFGWSYTSILTAIGNFYGMKNYASVLGTWQIIGAVIACPTSLIAGIVFDSKGSYIPMIVGILVVCILGLVCALFAKMPIPKDQEQTEMSS